MVHSLGIPQTCHIGIQQYRDWLFTFAIVRNPWDRLVSAYTYLLRGGRTANDVNARTKYLNSGAMSFEELVHGLATDTKRFMQIDHFKPMSWFLCDRDGNILADYVGRFEQLQKAFNRICDLVGIQRYVLPPDNVGKHRDYKDYYTPELRELVGKLYGRDAEIFGYDYSNSDIQDVVVHDSRLNG